MVQTSLLKHFTTDQHQLLLYGFHLHAHDCHFALTHYIPDYKKVQVGKDQEKAQSEKDSHSKNRDGKKN